MKRLLVLLIAGLFINSLIYSQKNEYRYIAIKFGMIHGFNPKPDFNPNKYLNASGGEEMQVHPVGSAYVPGFVFAFLYHFDFATNNAGIYTGFEYNLGGTGGKYKTDYPPDPRYNYSMKEIQRYHTVGVPIAFQYGPSDYSKSQMYGYVGAKVDFVVAMKSNQKVSWTKGYSSTKLTSEQFNRIGFNLFAGFNYHAYNIELVYYPKTFFNRLYIDPAGYNSFAGEPQKAFEIRTCINVPYGWLSNQSYWWRKKLRDFPWK